ncbi:MAG TPA: hypothetical protein VFJ43_06535 [Bacteroidia bacterium]|nr:hypothetical protein [Bacteroidia bacterium]
MVDDQLPDMPPFSLEQSDLVMALLPDAVMLLENDFLTSGLELKLQGKISPKGQVGDVFDLREIVSKQVQKTGGPGSEQFYRLLYRADIPEIKITELLNEEVKEPFEIRVAELLIIRALQKAFFRRKYKS